MLSKRIEMQPGNSPQKKVLSARTLPDIYEAQQMLRDWIKAHPEGEGMCDGFEQLSLMQDMAEEEQANLVNSRRQPAASLTAPMCSWVCLERRRFRISSAPTTFTLSLV